MRALLKKVAAGDVGSEFSKRCHFGLVFKEVFAVRPGRFLKSPCVTSNP
jgi:hypothetical protein